MMALSTKIALAVVSLVTAYVIAASYSFLHLQQQQQQQQNDRQASSAAASARNSMNNVIQKAAQPQTTTTTTTNDSNINHHHPKIRRKDSNTNIAYNPVVEDGRIILDDPPPPHNLPESDNANKPSSRQEQQSDDNDENELLLLFTTPQHFVEHRKRAERRRSSSVLYRKVITAYMEPPLHDTVPGTGNRGDLKNIKDWGTAPEFVPQLPLRTHTPNELRKYEYPNAVQTCHDMPGKFPIDRGLQFDKESSGQHQAIVWNVGDEPLPPNFVEQEAPYCPVELDPFLPWIHDVFPSQDGSKIEFIAQNKRRCRTGTKFTSAVDRLVPQVALLQSISVERITDATARQLAPNLWHPDNNNDDTESSTSTNNTTTRYRLAPYEEVTSPDGMYTRFIRRFHMTTTMDDNDSEPKTVFLGETLSQYPFNYELVSYRKGQRALLSPKGKDTRLFWTSNLHFNCPLPENQAFREAVATANTILTDGTPTAYVDLIPIRTSVRYEELYLTEDMIGPKDTWEIPPFDPVARWGNSNVLPRIEASGRWENIPICLPPQLVNEEKTETAMDMDTFETTKVTRKLVPNVAELPQKPHFLSACLWASAEFKTRGKHTGALTDTLDRLQEWIEFHLLVGFDHIYVYDNSGAHTNTTNLEPVLQQYPGKVTRIDWPSIVCNNNIPAHDSTGERSSQYAAESSCRARYGPFTEWMAAFDTDEYFVPMGNYTNLKDFLVDAGKEGTNILSLRSSRGRLRKDKSVEVENGNAIEKSADATYLEAYNCDSAGIPPKPSWADRARKQIYRTDYVLYHYVHYSTVTKGILKSYNETIMEGQHFNRRVGESTDRVTNELTEAVMVHAKSLGSDMTQNYKNRCRFDFAQKWKGCWVAYPWPSATEVNKAKEKSAHDADGMEYNCYINTRVDEYWVPKLRKALADRKKKKSSEGI